MPLKIKQIEYFLPKEILTNQELQKKNLTWDVKSIQKKTGVKKRHIATKNQTAYDLSLAACKKLLSKNDYKNIDAILYCTQSPDYLMPSNSFLLHKDLKLKKDVFNLDFNHGCSGYIYSLVIADSLIKSKQAKNILLVNADTYSKFINKKDKSTRVLFGDGAAATLIEDNPKSVGIVDSIIETYGKGFDSFWIPSGGMRNKDNSNKISKDRSGNERLSTNIHMDGFAVWSFINTNVPRQINKLLKKNNLNKRDIDLFIFHQASQFTLDSIIKSLKIDSNKTFINIEDKGNTVSATIPIAIKDAMNQKKLKRGALVVLSGFGIGLSYGSILIKF